MRVEPQVTIGLLNDYLIRLGWVLPIVPELDDLTIGGLIMGGGLETTSHKYDYKQFSCYVILKITPTIRCRRYLLFSTKDAIKNKYI